MSDHMSRSPKHMTPDETPQADPEANAALLSLDDTAGIKLDDTASSRPLHVFSDAPATDAGQTAADAGQPAADWDVLQEPDVQEVTTPEGYRIRQFRGGNRPGWLLPLIGGIAAAVGVVGVALSVYSVAAGAQQTGMHIASPMDLISSAQDTTDDASEILGMTETLGMDGNDLALPEGRTEVDVRDGKVLVTYQTQEDEAKTYDRATLAACALAMQLKGRKVASSTTRSGMSDEVMVTTVAEEKDDDSKSTSGYGYNSYGNQAKKIATPDMDTILSTGSSAQQASSVTVVAMNGKNYACVAVTLGVSNANYGMTADDVIKSSEAYGIDSTVFQKIKGWSKDFKAASEGLPKTPWNAEILVGEADREGDADNKKSQDYSGYDYGYSYDYGYGYDSGTDSADSGTQQQEQQQQEQQPAQSTSADTGTATATSEGTTSPATGTESTTAGAPAAQPAETSQPTASESEAESAPAAEAAPTDAGAAVAAPTNTDAAEIPAVEAPVADAGAATE